MKDLEIYIHIPFCAKKCAYCDFLSAPAGREQQEEYLQFLLQEIRAGVPMSAPAEFDGPEGKLICPKTEDYEVKSVFFGGGTPSYLPAEWIVQIMEALRSRFLFAPEPELEVTIECNPGTLSEGTAASKLEVYRSCGINRVSFGLQSAENRELAGLGRIHTWEMFLQSYKEAQNAGFRNINIDLMSALPGQTEASWERTLEKVLALKPVHISAYSLIIEEGTPFYALYHEDDLRRAAGEQPRFLPSEEEERAMYARTEELLKRAGLYRYEISNYAVPGFECRHNIGYWRGCEYMGFGLGASSMLRYASGGRCSCLRLQNPQTQAEYAQGIQLPPEFIKREDEIAEFMFLGLRMKTGISEREFFERFHCGIDSVYGGTLSELLEKGLLSRQNGRIALTERGTDLSNPVMAEFLPD